FIYKNMLENLEANLYTSDDFGPETTQLDATRLELANSYMDDISEMLDFRGDRKPEDIEDFNISDVAEEADNVFWNIAEMVDNRPFDTKKALMELQRLGEKTGFYHSGIEQGIERADRMKELHNKINEAESEAQEVRQELYHGEETELDDVEEDVGEDVEFIQSFGSPTEASMQRSLERSNKFVQELEEELPEEPETEKEREYLERAENVSENISMLERLL
ncbi:MAG: hypothetical protein J07AB43_11970, partial [Candidatus Nanosalina sp. J07AB43]